MDTNDQVWPCFATAIREHLTADDDPALWEAAVRIILADASHLCRCSRDKHAIFAKVGICSHWMSPHNGGDWFKDIEKFAWPTGYGSNGSPIFGLPEFDWSSTWEWNKRDAIWSPAPRIAGKRPLLLRVALPARTARHVRAVVHALWTPGSPTTPQRRFLQGYAFKKVDSNWQSVAIYGGEAPFDVDWTSRRRGLALAGEIYLQSFGRVYCAKLHHDNDKRCIFHHGYGKGREASPVSGSAQPGLEPVRTDVRAMWG